MYFGAIRSKIFSSLTSFVRCRYHQSVSIAKSFHTAKVIHANYEGDGKTTVSILNREEKHILLIDSISDLGFRLNNGVFVMGPIALFPRTVLQWNVKSIEYVNADALSLFYLLEPKLDILVLGTGMQSVMPSSEIMNLMKKKGIFVEVLSTEHACATFNFLNAEGRCIAGAFIPPAILHTTEEEIYLCPKGSGTKFDLTKYDL